MKKVLFLMVCALALTSCKLDLGINKVTPSDNIVTKTYKVDTFEEVNMSCVGHVEIVQNVILINLVLMVFNLILQVRKCQRCTEH